MRIAVATLIVAVLLPWNAHALTQEQIDAAIERGRIATDVKLVPAFLNAGTKSAKGAFAQNLFLGISSPPYFFGIRSCRQWIPNYVCVMGLDGKPIDRDLINAQCLDRDAVRVLVATNEAASTAISGAMGYWPVPAVPVTYMRLRVDSEVIEPIPEEQQVSFGDGNYSARFPGERIRSAKKVEIIATIGSQYTLTQAVPAKVLRALFQE